MAITEKTVGEMHHTTHCFTSSCLPKATSFVTGWTDFPLDHLIIKDHAKKSETTLFPGLGSPDPWSVH